MSENIFIHVMLKNPVSIQIPAKESNFNFHSFSFYLWILDAKLYSQYQSNK